MERFRSGKVPLVSELLVFSEFSKNFLEYQNRFYLIKYIATYYIIIIDLYWIII